MGNSNSESIQGKFFVFLRMGNNSYLCDENDPEDREKLRREREEGNEVVRSFRGSGRCLQSMY